MWMINNFPKIIILIFILSTSVNGAVDSNKDFAETVKVALRDAGNKILICNGDTTSIILPITELEDRKFQLSFENDLSFEPDDLMSIIENSLNKCKLPNRYRVQVLQCHDNQVAYSAVIYGDPMSNVVPCSGRTMPSGCYIIELGFLKEVSIALTPDNSLVYNNSLFFVSISIILLTLLGLYFWLRFMSKGGKKIKVQIIEEVPIVIGRTQFYPSDYKLISDAGVISLSQKECEILKIMAASPNEIITRENLTKQVWSDNGVIVGRSLDTYISKLRKKLQLDTSVRISNIRGVGYKLEIDGLN